MGKRLGCEQINYLKAMGGVGRFLVVPDKVSDSLCARGLMKSHGTDRSFVGITPAGLRALADLLDAGIIPEPVPSMKPSVTGGGE